MQERQDFLAKNWTSAHIWALGNHEKPHICEDPWLQHHAMGTEPSQLRHKAGSILKAPTRRERSHGTQTSFERHMKLSHQKRPKPQLGMIERKNCETFPGYLDECLGNLPPLVIETKLRRRHVFNGTGFPIGNRENTDLAGGSWGGEYWYGPIIHDALCSGGEWPTRGKKAGLIIVDLDPTIWDHQRCVANGSTIPCSLPAQYPADACNFAGTAMLWKSAKLFFRKRACIQSFEQSDCLKRKL